MPTYLISGLSVAKAATVINATITFVQLTASLSLVILLLHFMPTTNTAQSWNSISRIAHSSLWPAILRADSNSHRQSGAVASTVSFLTMLTTILVAVAGIILPLGLGEGPIIPSNFRQVDAVYVPDTSALALATRPDRENFVFGRKCVADMNIPCPGTGDVNVTTIPASLSEIFNSTSHSAFSMQYRQFFDRLPDFNTTVGVVGVSQTLILRNNTFATDGLVVDMSPEHPGVGFWNQTMPDTPGGGTWSQDILWLEPITGCVYTNLTLDYVLTNTRTRVITDFNLTDHGGLTTLTRTPPLINPDGQQFDPLEVAYFGGVYSNRYAMLSLNTTRETSFIGKQYPLNKNTSGALYDGVGKVSALPLSYLNVTAAHDLSDACRGFNRYLTRPNTTIIHIDCGIFLGTPLRTDGGDPRIFNNGSRWTQAMHSCSSATRASIQRITFQANNTRKLEDFRVSRQATNSTVLWAIENTDIRLAGIDLLWGHVDDRYENDPSLLTTRREGFYVPAGKTSASPEFQTGFPGATYAYAWSLLYGEWYNVRDLADYSGRSDYAIREKLQSLVRLNPTTGQAQIRNLMWVDIMANNLVGTPFNSTLWAADNLSTITYDFAYAIPGFILLGIWAASFFTAILLLLTRMLEFGWMRKVFNHTSIGRIVAGASALHLLDGEGENTVGKGEGNGHQGDPQNGSDVDLGAGTGKKLRENVPDSEWANSGGTVPVMLELDRKDNFEEIKLASMRSS